MGRWLRKGLFYFGILNASLASPYAVLEVMWQDGEGYEAPVCLSNRNLPEELQAQHVSAKLGADKNGVPVFTLSTSDGIDLDLKGFRLVLRNHHLRIESGGSLVRGLSHLTLSPGYQVLACEGEDIAISTEEGEQGRIPVVESIVFEGH